MVEEKNEPKEKPTDIDQRVLRKMIWFNSTLLSFILLICVNILLSIWLKKVAYQALAFLVSGGLIYTLWNRYEKKINPYLK